MRERKSMTVKKFTGWCPRCGLLAAEEDGGVCPGCRAEYGQPLAARPESKRDREPEYRRRLGRRHAEGAV